MSFAVRLEPINYRGRDIGRASLLEIPRQLDREAQHIKQLYEKCTASWGHKVEFRVYQTKTSIGRVTIVGTNDPIFAYVDKGTRPHFIFPRYKPLLIFRRGGFLPKTSSGIIGSSAGSPATEEPLVRSKGVLHPGTKARDFTRSIQAYWKTSFDKSVQEVITRAIQEAQRQ